MRGRAIVAAAAALAGLMAVAAPGASTERASADGARAAAASVASRPELRTCDLGPPRPFRCGSISVPADRSHRSARRLRVGFAVQTRREATRPSLGTIIGVEGGPGYAATDQPFVSSLSAVLGPLLRRHDLVLIDARGTGSSGALLCNELQRGLIDEQIAVGQCARRLGKRFSDYTTAETVQDIEAVRKALGLGRVFLYGDSYGTLQGRPTPRATNRSCAA